ALLLHTIEDFSNEAVGQIMGISADEAADLISIAYREMAQFNTGNILIIEDEPIIAMDLETIAAEMGHRVTGIARTEADAVRLAAAEPFDLILSDIALADGTNGIDATQRVLAAHGARPVIFITAFPERLLTGEGLEPAFLISKPYNEDQVRSAISQAMFFCSTETLSA
ncbi:MAG: response regulator, partial [Pseudomonadota bacterium]